MRLKHLDFLDWLNLYQIYKRLVYVDQRSVFGILRNLDCNTKKQLYVCKRDRAMNN